MECGRLRHPYIAVMKEGRLSYGGNQQWSRKKAVQKYGCGVIAGTDLLLYLSLHKEYCKGKEFKNWEKENGILEAEEYMELAETMRRHYFPVIPGLGMPGWLLSGGVNRYFRANRIPLKVSFGVLGRNLRNRIGAMLAHDIPVILAVGPNFPLPLKKHKLTFYEKKGSAYEESCSVAAHFVAVTALDGPWMQISSWGKMYYINLCEYQEYVRRHSLFLISNIFYIRKRKRISV
ncbi:MAG: hypothetical protein KHY34_02195 [Lachnospiraceae bacterium]|nr:hypothetical protein [Lachnospiraceae bacterium]